VCVYVCVRERERERKRESNFLNTKTNLTFTIFNGILLSKKLFITAMTMISLRAQGARQPQHLLGRRVKQRQRVLYP